MTRKLLELCRATMTTLGIGGARDPNCRADLKWSFLPLDRIPPCSQGLYAVLVSLNSIVLWSFVGLFLIVSDSTCRHPDIFPIERRATALPTPTALLPDDLFKRDIERAATDGWCTNSSLTQIRSARYSYAARMEGGWHAAFRCCCFYGRESSGDVHYRTCTRRCPTSSLQN